MENATTQKITVECSVNSDLNKVWKMWSDPNHITQWCTATEEWHTPRAENDLRKDGRFVTRMESKDGKIGFDFGGIYTEVRINDFIAYTMDDGRKTEIQFSTNGNEVHITETFEAESINPIEIQRGGWQAILDNFKKHVESN